MALSACLCCGTCAICAGQARDGCSLEQLMKDMRGNGRSPDAQICNTLMQSLAKDGGDADCVKLLGDMRSIGGVAPDVVTYNTALNALVRQ